MKKSKRALYNIASTLILIPAPVLAQTAQPAGEAEASQIGDIIVTAQKRSEKLSDVPLSISASTGEQLLKQGVTSVGDLQRVVPGLAYTQSPYGAPIFTIRGIGFFDEAVGISPTVSVYVDQVPLPFSRATEGASLDLERVEVLKGPQGTLFGQNSTGGAINYIAAKPTDSFKAGVDASYGRFNDVDLQGFISGPLSETLTARLAVRSNWRDDWQKSTSRIDTLGHRDFKTARLLLDWQPSDTLKFEFNANGWKNKSDTQATQFLFYQASGGGPDEFGLLAEPAAPNEARAADWNPNQSFRRDDSFYQFSLRGDLELGDAATLTSISAYSKLAINSPIDVDGTRFPILGIGKDADTRTFSQELRLAGSIGDTEQLKWMIGGNYQHDKVDDIEHVSNQGSNSQVGPFDYITFDNSALQRINTKAVFGSLDYKLTDTLTAQGSVRYTDQKRSLNGCLIDSGNGEFSTAFGFLSTVFLGNPHAPTPGDPSYIPPGGCVTLDSTTNLPVPVVHKELHQNNLSWRAGLSWKPENDFLLYGNVTRGYKAGSFGTIPSVRPEQFDPVTQEQVTAYEVGFKTSLLDRTMQLTGAVFYYDYKNKQLLAYIADDFFGSLPGLVSVPKSRVTGAELNLVWRPVQALTLSAGGTYIKSKVTSDFETIGPVGTTFVNVKGEGFPNTPKWNFVGDAEYRFPVSSDWNAFVGGNVTYRSKADSTFAGPSSFDIKAYALVDLRLGFEKEDGSLRVQAWGRNITNKYYWSHVDHVLDTVNRTAGMPVTYGVSVSTRF
jgi:outer membrane receptor protein involved in Fe transport